jgi:hypothetical protein
MTTDWPDWQEISEQARREWEKIEEDIRRRVQAKFQQRRLLREEAEDLALMEVPPPVHPDWIRPFFFRPILRTDTLFYTQGGYNVHPDMLFQSTRPWLARLRAVFRKVLRFFLNIDALVGQQARFNDLQVELDDRLVHHTRLLHELVHRLVAELTRLNLQHQELAHRVQWLEEQVEWYRQRHRVLESWLRAGRSEPEAGK